MFCLFLFYVYDCLSAYMYVRYVCGSAYYVQSIVSNPLE